MSTLTREQWMEIEGDLKIIYGTACLRCDGHLISCVREQTGEGRSEIAVYIDGYIRGEMWFVIGESEDGLHDVGRKFWKVIKTPFYKPAQLKKYEKAFGKRAAKEDRIYRKHYSLKPYWLRAADLCRHLRTHNDNIELIGCKDMLAELDCRKAQTAEEPTNA